jgi:hypothetical protein
MTLGQNNDSDEREEKAWKEFKGKFRRQYKDAKEEGNR